MSKVLVLTSSALGDGSVSNKLAQDAVAKLRAANPAVQVVERNLGESHIPHLTQDSANVLRSGAPANQAQKDALDLSNALVEELKTADIIVIGSPMYNFGITSTLKAWFDHVLRAGVTFRYTEAGPEGLLKGKRAIVIESRGGLYSEGPAQIMDAQEPHLRGLLGFIGISDVSFIRAEKLAFGPEAVEQSIGAAKADLSKAVAVIAAKAA